MHLAFLTILPGLVVSPKFSKSTFTTCISILMLRHKYALSTSWAFPLIPRKFIAFHLIELVYRYLAAGRRLCFFSQLFLPLT